MFVFSLGSDNLLLYPGGVGTTSVLNSGFFVRILLCIFRVMSWNSSFSIAYKTKQGMFVIKA